MKMELVVGEPINETINIDFSDNLESLIESLMVMGNLLEYKSNYYCVKTSSNTYDIWLDFQPLPNLMYAAWIEVNEHGILKTGISIGKRDKYNDWNYESYHHKNDANEEDVIESFRKLCDLL